MLDLTEIEFQPLRDIQRPIMQSRNAMLWVIDYLTTLPRKFYGSPKFRTDLVIALMQQYQLWIEGNIGQSSCIADWF